jgi:hypothetical protein
MKKRQGDRTLECLKDPGCWPNGSHLPLARDTDKGVVFIDDPRHLFFQNYLTELNVTTSILYDHIEDVVAAGWEVRD